MVYPTAQLNVHLADREMRASVGLVRVVSVKLLPGFIREWDFWVVLLAMDAMLGTPWLLRV